MDNEISTETKKNIKVEADKDNTLEKWVHGSFAGGSFAYCLAMIDKVELIKSDFALQLATVLFLVSLVVNSITCLLYYRFHRYTLETPWIGRKIIAVTQSIFPSAILALFWYLIHAIFIY